VPCVFIAHVGIYFVSRDELKQELHRKPLEDYGRYGIQYSIVFNCFLVSCCGKALFTCIHSILGRLYRVICRYEFYSYREQLRKSFDLQQQQQLLEEEYPPPSLVEQDSVKQDS